MKKRALPVLAIAALCLFITLSGPNHTSTAASSPDVPPFFSDFETWYKSTYRSDVEEEDSLLELLIAMERYTFPTGSLYHSSPQKYSFLDINGDGLTDFAYHAGFSHGDWGIYLALMINNGNNDFDMVYRCVMNSSSYYYGNCAYGAPPINESNMLFAVGLLISYSYGFNSPGETVDSKYKQASASVDLNGDGLIDLITSQSYTGYLALINRGNLEFEIVPYVRE